MAPKLAYFHVAAVLAAWAGTVPAAPVITAGPFLAPAEVFVGEEVRFRVEARDQAGLPISYRWRFGDSSAGTDYGPAPEAVHRYGEPGHYRASIYVRNSENEIANAFLPVTVLTRATAVRPAASSSLILDTARGRLWCVNPDHGTVSALHPASRSLLFEVPAGLSPQTLALAPDGTVWVANRGSATVSVLASADGRRLAEIRLPYGSRPHGLAFDPAGKAAWLTLEGKGSLLRLDPAGRSVTGEIPLGPTPRALAISGDGRRILVTRFISPRDHAEVWEIDAPAFAKVRTFTLARDLSVDTETGGGGVLNYLSAVAISPDGKRAAVAAVKANTARGRLVSGVDLIPENTVRTALAYLDLAGDREDPADRNDFDNSALASALAYNAAGDLLFTALMGSDAVHARDPYNNGAVLERNKAAGAAPIGLALDDRARVLYVHAFLDRTVTAWDIAAFHDSAGWGTDTVVSRPLGTMPTTRGEALAPEVLRGKRLFYGASNPAMSFNGYISCAVCHLDGGTDGRVWDFTDRGEGLRRTTSLLGRAGLGHGPVHWSANFDEIQDFENDIRGPFGGTGLLTDAHFGAGTRGKTLGDPKAGLSADLDALAAYVTSLARVNPSPYRNADGTSTPDAAAGEAIFNSAAAGCARCHVPPAYTDSRLPGPGSAGGPPSLDRADTGSSGAGGLGPGDYLTPEGFLVHDVGTLRPSSGRRLGDNLRGLDTPTLKGLWETGPYLHDGSAAGLAEVIGERNAGDRHGKTSHLTSREKEQLIAFLLQLDDGALPAAGARENPRARRAGPGLAPGSAGAAIRLPPGWRNAQVTVHDLGGRTLASLGAGRPAPGGAWEWTWDGAAAAGKARPGLYPVRVRRPGGGELALRLAWMP